MKITSYAVARPAYGDRNSSSTTNSYLATVGPHAFTIRWTQTIAAGKKCLVETGQSRIRRTTAATVLGDVVTEMIATSGSTDIYVLNGFLYNLAIGAMDRVYIPTVFTLFAGEVFRATTVDLSTGGINEIILSSKGTNYDA